ncbi:MAG: HAD hydrolase family protein, partial [Flavobacteriales bacterium]|nr:HAD hydrolase family protein [Flavobacteriales bacterium]
MISYKEKLPKITTFIFDVDGVLTNGEIFLMKEDFVRSLNSRDAYAMQYAAKSGFRILIITGGASELVAQRLLSLGIDEVRLRSKNKLSVYKELKEKYGFEDEEVLYMGDDIPDYEILERVGVSTCPQDAAVEIKAISDYQSPYDGGKYCVRDVIEQTLRVQDKWFKEHAHEW